MMAGQREDGCAQNAAVWREGDSLNKREAAVGKEAIPGPTKDKEEIKLITQHST